MEEFLPNKINTEIEDEQAMISDWKIFPKHKAEESFIEKR